ncbi:MAG: hypothetical protein ACIARQ_07955 [Phycisphaerales bacterium JB061]
MSKYDSIPILTPRQRVRRLLFVFFILIVIASIYALVPGLYEWVRQLPAWGSLFWILIPWLNIGWIYSTTVLGVDTLGDEVVIHRRAGVKRVPLSSIAEIEPVRKKGKLVRIRLRDRLTRSLPTIPIISGTRRIENAEELLQELSSLSEANLSGGGVPPPIPLV